MSTKLPLWLSLQRKTNSDLLPIICHIWYSTYSIWYFSQCVNSNKKKTHSVEFWFVPHLYVVPNEFWSIMQQSGRWFLPHDLQLPKQPPQNVMEQWQKMDWKNPSELGSYGPATLQPSVVLHYHQPSAIEGMLPLQSMKATDKSSSLSLSSLWHCRDTTCICPRTLMKKFHFHTQSTKKNEHWEGIGID